MNFRRRATRRAPGVSPWLLPALLLVLPAAAWLAGCAGLRTEPAVDDAAQYLEPAAGAQHSLVFGYLDMSEAPTDLGWIEFRQVAPRTDTPYYQMRVHEGVFYMEKFPPGTFLLGEFGGRRWDGKQLAYSLPRTSPAVRVSVAQPGLHFAGAYRYRPVTDNGTQAGRFAIDAVAAPSEPEVLARILPYARGTDWEARIRARLGAGR